MSEHQKLKAQIKKFLAEFDLKLEDPHNLSSLFQILEQKGHITTDEIREVEVTLLRSSFRFLDGIIGKADTYIVFNHQFEIVFCSEQFVEQFQEFMISDHEKTKLIDLLKLVQDTGETIGLELIIHGTRITGKIFSVFKGNYYILLIMID